MKIKTKLLKNFVMQLSLIHDLFFEYFQHYRRDYKNTTKKNNPQAFELSFIIKCTIPHINNTTANKNGVYLKNIPNIFRTSSNSSCSSCLFLSIL